MGAILCAPIRSQLLCRVGDERFRVGGAQMQGFRRDMEDAHCICLNMEGHPGTAFFGVYDGHSGDKVSAHLAQNLHHVIDRLGPDLEDEEIQRAVVAFDIDVGKSQQLRDNGSTCVFVLVRPLKDDDDESRAQSSKGRKAYRVTAVNVGDSRAMLLRADGTLVSMTVDHKPSTPEENRRIRAAGGFEQNDRVDGELAMSRAIGDFKYKVNPQKSPVEQKVIALPTITHNVAYQGDRLLVVCDGIVERITNKEVATFVHATHKGEYLKEPAEVMRELNLYSLARGSTDNHSAVLVCFENGVGYTKPEQFIAGPLSHWKQDRTYVAAYLKNAKAWGYSGESLMKMISEADEKQPKDWKKIRGTSDWKAWWPAMLLICLVLVILYNISHDKASLWHSTSKDDEDEYW